MEKQSVRAVTLRALMRSGSCKILALLPVALFASPAVAGPVTWLPTSYPATISYIIWNTQDGFPVGGTTGSISGPATPADLPFWLQYVDINGKGSFTSPNGPGTASVDLSIPAVTAKAASLVPPAGGHTTSTTVDITLQWFVQLAGPFSHTLMPVYYDGAYAMSGAATNQINVTEVTDGLEQQFTCANGCSSGLYSGTMNIRPGQTVGVTLGAIGYSSNGGPAGIAYIDPHFYLDPAEIAAGYSLEFSEFVGNAPPASGSGPGTGVPEPLTLALFGAGLAGAAAMRRRKKKAEAKRSQS